MGVGGDGRAGEAEGRVIGLAEGEGEGEGPGDGLGEGEGEGLGDGDGDGEGKGEGDGAATTAGRRAVAIMEYSNDSERFHDICTLGVTPGLLLPAPRT